jgi:hypothetical protein
VVADHREERLQAAALEHGRREALVHLERARSSVQLLAGEMRDRRLRDGHERDS